MSELDSWLGESSNAHQTQSLHQKGRLTRSKLLGFPLVDLCLHIAPSGLLLRQTGWIDRVGDLTYLLRHEGDFELDHPQEQLGSSVEVPKGRSSRFHRPPGQSPPLVDRIHSVNGDNKWLSRSLWLCVIIIIGSFTLAWKLNDGAVWTVVITAVITGWFAGKGVEAFQTRNKPL